MTLKTPQRLTTQIFKSGCQGLAAGFYDCPLESVHQHLDRPIAIILIKHRDFLQPQGGQRLADQSGFVVAASADVEGIAIERIDSAQINIMTSPPARNFLNSSHVNAKSLRDNKGEPVFEMHADNAVAQQPSA